MKDNNRGQPSVVQQPAEEEIPTSWGDFLVHKESNDSPAFTVGKQKEAYDLKNRQYVTMQVYLSICLNF